jgi:hypothetical protein
MIRFEDKKDYFELGVAMQEDEALPSRGDVYITVRVLSSGFSGENELWVDSKSVRHFCRSLVELEKTRRGSAELESISPGELKLKVSSLDRAGHMGIEGRTGYLVQKGNFSAYHSVEFGFEFDPSQLLKAIRDSWLRRNAEQNR